METGVRVQKSSGDNTFMRVAILLQAWINFFHCVHFFGRAILLVKGDPNRQTTGNIAFCSLLPTQDLRLSF